MCLVYTKYKTLQKEETQHDDSFLVMFQSQFSSKDLGVFKGCLEGSFEFSDKSSLFLVFKRLKVLMLLLKLIKFLVYDFDTKQVWLLLKY